MAAWFDGVTLRVEVAWDDTILTPEASRTYTDHGGSVLSFTTNRGRSTELDTYSAGTADVVLYDPSRLFDPSNTAGTYYGKHKPMKPMRLRVTVGATTATLFAGFITGCTLSYDHDGKVPLATLACVDAFQVLDGCDLPGSAYAAAVLATDPDYYWTMQSIDGIQLWPSAGSVELVSRPVSTGYFNANDTTTLPLGEPVMMSSGSGDISPVPALPKAMAAWVYDPGPYALGSPYMDVRPDATTRAAIYVAATELVINYSNSATSTRNVSTTVAIGDLTGREALVAATFSDSGIVVYVNGVQYASIATEAGTRTMTGGIASVGIYGADAVTPPEASISHAAIWTTATPSAADFLAMYEAGTIAHGHPIGERSGARIGRILDACDWPTADRALSTGATVLDQWTPGGGSALEACRILEQPEQGLFFAAADGKITFRDRAWQQVNTLAVTSQATFGDTTSEIRYTDDLQVEARGIDFVRNVIDVTYGSAGNTVTTTDTTSRNAYGRQRDSVDATTMPASDGWVARQLAAYRLRARKDPADRVQRISIPVRRDTTTWLPTLAGLDLGHRVTLNRRPTGGTGSMSLQLTVQGIRHEVDKSAAGWRCDLYLAPAPESYIEADYMLAGDATYGVVGSTHTAVF